MGDAAEKGETGIRYNARLQRKKTELSYSDAPFKPLVLECYSIFFTSNLRLGFLALAASLFLYKKSSLSDKQKENCRSLEFVVKFI